MSEGKEAMGFDLFIQRIRNSNSGGQRINEYDELIESMKKKNVGINGMEFYINAFKYAIPPHWWMGNGI
jgi:aspartyl/asparaginyl-tRNA synthetase